MSHKTLRRFHGYDYSRGGSMFVTTGLAERTPLFGRVDQERVVLSEQGYMKDDCFSLDKILVQGNQAAVPCADCKRDEFGT